MANEKIFDKTKSAAANETAVNNKFDELSHSSGQNYHTSRQTGYQKEQYAFGDNVDVGVFPMGLVTSLLNSVNLSSQITSSRLFVPSLKADGATQGAYSHVSNVKVYNNKAYVSYFRNVTSASDWSEYYNKDENGGDDYSVLADARTTLCIIDMPTWTVEKEIELSKHGDVTDIVVNGQNLYVVSSGGDPNIYIDEANGIVRVIVTSRIAANLTDRLPVSNAYRADNMKCLLYIDYNINTGEVSPARMCKFVCSNSADVPNQSAATDFSNGVDFNVPMMREFFGLNHINEIQMSAQYATHATTIIYKDGNGNRRERDGEVWNYINYSSYIDTTNGLILKTKDFKTFYFWMIPVYQGYNNGIGIKLKYERSIAEIHTAWGKRFITACRLTNNLCTFIGVIVPDYIDETGEETVVIPPSTGPWREIPGGGSRPCFFSPYDALGHYVYLMHQADESRLFYNIEKATPNLLSGSYVSTVGGVFTMTYPSIVRISDGDNKTYNGGIEWIVSYTFHDRVCVSKFKQLMDFTNIVPMVQKFIDTFGPEES